MSCAKLLHAMLAFLGLDLDNDSMQPTTQLWLVYHLFLHVLFLKDKVHCSQMVPNGSLLNIQTIYTKTVAMRVDSGRQNSFSVSSLTSEHVQAENMSMSPESNYVRHWVH